jgi:hypothetical protein
LPLLLTRRVPGYLLLALAAAGAAGMLRSGVFTSVLMGYQAMPVPRPHLAWPPRLPNWKNESDGEPLRSWKTVVFFAFELGPVFFGSVTLALWRGDARRRLLVLAFTAGLLVAMFVQPSGWPKADLDRFFFYGTPFVFMLAAALVEALGERFGRLRDGKALVGISAALVAVVCAPSTIWPTYLAGTQLQDSFARHDIGGDLRRNLAVAAAREPILTTADRADELVMVGFTVIAPFTSSNVGSFSHDDFDGYVAQNANRAVWWFLPERDARVSGRHVEGRDRDYVLVRSAPGNPR